MNYKPYKERRINYMKPVEIYRCLNRSGKVFSIRQSGVVVGHTIEDINFNLMTCRFVVLEAGKKRCQTTQQRNVHAYVVGIPVTTDHAQDGVLVEYDPYSKLGFVANGQEVTSAKYIMVTKDGIYGKHFL